MMDEAMRLAERVVAMSTNATTEYDLARAQAAGCAMSRTDIVLSYFITRTVSTTRTTGCIRVRLVPLPPLTVHVDTSRGAR